MRRVLVLGVSLALCLTATMPAGADDGRRRVARRTYAGAEGNDYMFTSDCRSVAYFSGDDDTTFLQFRTRPAERWMTLEIADEVPGMSVIAFVAQGVRAGDRHVICGGTERPIAITGGASVLVSLMRGVSPEGPSYFTNGTVTATFSR